MGVADKKRARGRGGQRRRGNTQQAPDRVSPRRPLTRLPASVSAAHSVLSAPQGSLHHPAGGVGAVWRLRHGHLLRSGTHTHTQICGLSLPLCLDLKALIRCRFSAPQLVSIITDETPIEQMRNRLMIKDRGSTSSSSPSSSSSQLQHHPSHTRKPKLALLREVFGRGACVCVCVHQQRSRISVCLLTLLLPSGSVLCWLLPLHSNPPSVGGISYSALPDYDV